MHGRLFGVQEGKQPDRPDFVQRKSAEGADSPEAAGRRQARMQEAEETFRTKKPARPYLDAPNPLLKKEKPPEEGVREKIPHRIKTQARADAEAGEKGKTQKNLSPRKLLTAAGIGLLAAGYLTAGVHFSDHFYPGSEFFGIPASGLTVSQVKDLVQKKVDGYALEIEGRSSSSSSGGMRDRILANQVGLRYRDNGLIDRKMKGQFSAFWPVMLGKSLLTRRQETLGTEYDASKVNAVLRNLSVFDPSRVTAPKDAELKYSETGAYVSKEVMGTTLEEDRARQALIQALDEGRTRISLEEEGLYRNPSVYSDDAKLNVRAKALNQVLGANLTLDFGDRSLKLDPQTVAERLLSLDRDGAYYLDVDKLIAYVNDLAEEYDTTGAERSFRTSLGTRVSLWGGDYGWTLDTERTAERLKEALLEKDQGTFEPVYSNTGLCRDADDIGDSYVEINLTNQHMWFYHDGSLVVDTPVVTGNPQKGNETPSGGVWSLKGKYQHATLKGQGYATPVDYWMPFNGGVGIHDLQSRYYFGGAVYNGAGSHGCVNTPLSAVSLIYHSIEPGTPVIVYEDQSQEATSQSQGMQDIRSINAYVTAAYGTVSNEDVANADLESGQTFHTDAAATDQTDAT